MAIFIIVLLAAMWDVVSFSVKLQVANAQLETEIRMLKEQLGLNKAPDNSRVKQ
ncbi:MAG: hypothetical protein HYX22_00990 [Candidatus Yanofskybacteria bacterium]|nr:hypothetical protein [Candidatus Yanofskybacteria bacterium]